MISKAYLRNFGLAVAALASGVMLAAQLPAGGGAPQPAQPGMPQQPTPGASPDASLPEQTSQQNMADQSFVWNTIENDDNQIRLSQLAEQKSASPDIKQLSQQMVKVHNELNGQLQPVARQLQATTPRGPSKKEKKELEKLQALSGPDFDSAYLEDMGRMQRESLKHFRAEAKVSQNAALRQAASQDAQVLAQNYQMLQKVAQAHNIDLDAKEKK